MPFCYSHTLLLSRFPTRQRLSIALGATGSKLPLLVLILQLAPPAARAPAVQRFGIEWTRHAISRKGRRHHIELPDAVWSYRRETAGRSERPSDLSSISNRSRL